MNLFLLLDIIFLIVDIFISIWNSYNSGKIAGYRRTLGRVFYVLGGFLPMSYVFIIVITFILSYFGYVSFSSALFLLAGSYLFFGFAIIIWGVIATYYSFVSTVKNRSWLSGFITVYDAFATIFDAWDYITSFFSNVRAARKAIDSSDFSIIDVVIIIVTGLAVGFLVSYAAFKEGLKSVRTRSWYNF
ncbi:hypothetical protein DFR86_09965 [Acidianus sulfidivorans JP7]|uniref:Uncharacterized protein n=1 Tax=Acidianus sulfidivorans JP7 TaxID=619593 RepID=A0A2U9IPD4_9CREN|nr:hypothetical protein [Acidianus sulfidivorans]AWR97834.1 hypothetical protein DFR86_09965 [Acidianus sulfidivorans JP7]